VDGGRTWTPWYNLPNGQFYDVFTDNQFPYQVYGAQQDSGTAAVLSRSDYGGIRDSDWMPVSGFEFGDIAPDPLNPRWVYTQGWYDVLRRFDRTTGQVAVVFTPEPGDRFTNLPPTVFSPVNPRRLYLASQLLRATDDGGRTWVKLGPDLTTRPAPPAGAASGRGGLPGRGGRGAAISALAPSPLAAQVIWAGTSNGLIQLSRDGGRTWNNVSPPELGPRSSVTNLEASHRDPARAYAAIEDGGSSAPFVYRTSDYGRSWQAIVAGLPGNVRARVVREDPEDPNLLYAGTEMGAWVSFDRGDAWQPLQLNLPHTVVSDMKVHGDDLVISTYGRSLWILDDVTPLRQVSQAMAAGGAYMFRPEVATRVRWDNDQDTPLPPEVPMGQNPPEGAVIDYYLPSPAQGPMTLAIYDSAGRLVNQYMNVAPPPDNSPPNVPEYWFKPPAVLNPAAGMHRFVWDMRCPTPKALTYSYYGNMLDYTEYTLTWHAILGHTPRQQPVGPLAIPGVYQVKLTVNGQTYSRPLTVKNDPRSPAGQPDLEAQLRLEQRVMAGLETTYAVYYQIDRVRQALAAIPASAGGNGGLAEAAAGLERQLAPLAAGTGNSGFGVANRDLARRLQDLEFGDYNPTASDTAAVEASCSQITQAAATLEQLNRSAVPQLNQLLAAAQQAPLPPITPPPGAPCGR
ncbi:MAG: WD40/YVTN/BNR-like repeat-containing protein, partial [Terriglobales bacterium]